MCCKSATIYYNDLWRLEGNRFENEQQKETLLP